MEKKTIINCELIATADNGERSFALCETLAKIEKT